MEHTEIRRQLSAYLDGEVSPAQRTEIDAHLVACPRCRAALSELERTIGLIHDLPRVEPPPWLAAKTMARVREVAEPRPSLWQRLFFPLRLKLPLEAAAIVFLCVTGYYLTRTLAPELTTMPSPAPTPQERAPSLPSSPEQQSVPAKAPQLPAPAQRKVSPPPPAAPSAAPASAPKAAPEKSTTAPASPASAPAAPAELLREVPAVVKEEQTLRGFSSEPAGAPMHTAKKAKKAAPPAVEGTPATPPASRCQAVLWVEDVAAVEVGVAEAVRRAGGTVLRREPMPAGTLLVVRIDATRLPDVLTRLEQLGRLRQRPEAETGATLELTIRLEPNR